MLQRIEKTDVSVGGAEVGRVVQGGVKASANANEGLASLAAYKALFSALVSIFNQSDRNSHADNLDDALRCLASHVDVSEGVIISTWDSSHNVKAIHHSSGNASALGLLELKGLANILADSATLGQGLPARIVDVAGVAIEENIDIHSVLKPVARVWCVMPMINHGRLLGYLALGGDKAGAALSGVDNSSLTDLVGLFAMMLHQKEIEHKLDSDFHKHAQLQRWASLGHLTAAYIHQLCQPLSVITGSARLARRHLEKMSQKRTNVDRALMDIEQNSDKAITTIKNLRWMLSHRQDEYVAFDLREIICGVVDIVKSDVRARNIVIESRFATSVPKIVGDEVLIKQVLLNLVTNAVEAIQQKRFGDGRIVVECGMTDNGNVQVSVNDNGVGLGDGSINGLFEVGYSTKDRGTGMGLGISRSIVERHGGRLWATPGVEQGASFHVVLPLTHDVSGET